MRLDLDLALAPRLHLLLRPCTHLLVHLAWATQRREPLIPAEADRWMHELLTEKVDDLGCEPYAIGCASDHVHVLLRHPPTVAVFDLVQRLKSHATKKWNQLGRFEGRLSWAPGYWAQSTDPRADVVDPIVLGIDDHRSKHHAGEEWERSFDDE